MDSPLGQSNRIRAHVTWVGDDYLHAIDDHGERYYVNRSGMQTTGQYTFDDLWINSWIELTPIRHPKGWRGIEVRVLAI